MTLLLAYHRVLPAPPKDNIHVLSTGAFERQVKLLADSGLDIAPPDEFDSPPKGGGHRVGITFDDGFASDLRCAEVLHKHGMRALFFISSAPVGTPGYLRQEDLGALIDMGMKIGSHSHEHIQMTPGCAGHQARTSKESLTWMTGEPIEDFAFVGGVCSEETIAIVLASGYKRVYTTEWGVNGESNVRTGVYRRNCLMQGMSDKQFLDLVTAKNEHSRQALYRLKTLAARHLPRGAYNRLQRLYVSMRGSNKASLPS